MCCAVPDGLEEPVREAQGQDVLGRLLAQEVVDAEHLAVREDRVDLGVERDRAREVGAEGLLHDDPGPLGEPGVGEHLHHRGRGRGRHAEVVEVARVAAQLRGGDARRAAEPLGALPGLDVGEAAGEVVPVVLGDASRPNSFHAARAKTRNDSSSRGSSEMPDDAELGHQAGPREVQQARDELALGEVAGGPEEDDDVRLERRDRRGWERRADP